MKTSLNNAVINRLPFDKKKGVPVYHRPQVGSGIYLKGGLGESINQGISDTFRLNGKQVANPKTFRQTEYENPNVNALRAFDLVPADNFYQTRKLVLAFNHSGRRDSHMVGTFRIAYYRTLAACNMCYNCKKPLKVHKTHIAGDSRAEHDNWFAEETPANKIEKRFDGGRRIRSAHGKPLNGSRYRPHSKGTNTAYGDIKSHFRYVVVKTKDGEIKYRFVYIDGTGRRIEQRKRPGTNIRYFVHVKDGVETKIIPQSSYRITGLGCKCKRGK